MWSPSWRLYRGGGGADVTTSRDVAVLWRARRFTGIATNSYCARPDDTRWNWLATESVHCESETSLPTTQVSLSSIATNLSFFSLSISVCMNASTSPYVCLRMTWNLVNSWGAFKLRQWRKWSFTSGRDRQYHVNTLRIGTVTAVCRSVTVQVDTRARRPTWLVSRPIKHTWMWKHRKNRLMRLRTSHLRLCADSCSGET